MNGPNIIIPFHNKFNLLRKTLYRLVNISKISASKIILVNDSGNSREKKEEVLKGIAKSFKYIQNNKNIGCNKSIYKAVTKCKNKYFLPLGNGDLLMPEAFPDIRKQLKKFPNCNLFLWPLIEILDEDNQCGKIINKVNSSSFNRVIYPDEFRSYFYGKPLIGQGCYNVSKWQELGGFRSELEWHADHFLCHILGNIGPVFLFHKPMGFFLRSHDSYGAKSRSCGQEKVCLRAISWLDRPNNVTLRTYLIESGAFCVFEHVLSKVLRGHPSRSIYLDAKMRRWLLLKKIRGLVRHPIPKNVKEAFRRVFRAISTSKPHSPLNRN